MGTEGKKPFYKRWWFIVLAIIIVISIINSMGDDKSSTQEPGASTTAQAIKTSSTAKEEVLKVGDTITFDDSEWVVLESVNKGSKIKSNNQFQENLVSEDGVYLMVKFKVKNLTNKEERILDTPKIKDDKGREFKDVDMQSFYLPEGAKTIGLEAIPASMSRTFYSIYEVAGDAQTVYFEARSLSAFAKKKLVLLGNLN